MLIEKPTPKGNDLSPEEVRKKIESLPPDEREEFINQRFDTERRRRAMLTDEERAEEDKQKRAEYLASDAGREMQAYFDRIDAAKRELPLEWLKTVRILVANQMQWADSIGVVANPVPDMHGGNFSNIKLMDADIFRETHQKGFMAVTSPFADGEILLPADVVPQDAFHHINHELVHTTDGTPRVDKILEGMRRSSKIKDTKSILPSEAVTEMINLESLKYLRDQDPSRDYLRDINTVGYVPHLLIINEVVEELAKKEKVDSLEIRKRLYRAYYAGTLDEVWDMLAEVDPAWPGIIRSLRRFEDVNDLMGFCVENSLNVGNIRKILDAYFDHEEVKIFGEVKVRTRETDKEEL